MSGLLDDIVNSRGWGRIQRNIIEPFSSSTSWIFNTLFVDKEIATPNPGIGERGWGNIAALIPFLISFGLAVSIGLPLAFAWHSLQGFVDVIRWTAETTWDKDYHDSFSQTNTRNNLQAYIFALPGYLLSTPFCLIILVARVIKEIVKPFAQAFWDAAKLGLKAFFSTKSAPASKLLEGNFFRAGHKNLRRIPAFIGHIIGFAFSILFLPLAFLYQTISGFIEVARWGVKRIALGQTAEEAGFQANISERYTLQHGLASPGYLFGLAFCGLLSIGRLVVEGLLYNILFKGILKPFGEAFLDAAELGFNALFLTKPEPTHELLSLRSDPFLRADHSGLRRFPAFIGHVAGFVVTALLSPFALIYQSFFGFIEVTGWGMAKIVLDEPFSASSLQKDHIRNRYVLQHFLAGPGYLLGLAFCGLLGVGRLILQYLIYEVLFKGILKPIGQGFIDTIRLFGKALFTDRIPSKSADIQPGELIDFKPLGDFKKGFSGWSTIPGLIGRGLATMLTIPLLVLAWGWHTLSTLANFVAWGTNRMWSKQYTETFKKAMEKRYVGQDALGILGYVGGVFVCLILSPFCLAHRYKSEIGAGIKTGFKGLVAFLALVFVGEAKSAFLVFWNLLAFAGNLITLKPKKALLSLEKAFVHLLGFISFGLLDAAYRSTFGRPQLVGVSMQDAGANPEKQKAAKLRKIYNALDNRGALPHKEAKESKNKSVDWGALDAALTTERKEPTFSHVYKRRVVKSTDFGEDSPTEKALKRITEEFKRESEAPREAQVASVEQKGFFERRQHITIIDQMIRDSHSVGEQDELIELENALDEFIDGHKHRGDAELRQIQLPARA